MIRSRVALLFVAIVIAASACAHRLAAPAAWQWGMPVYPGSTLQGKSSAKASFVLYSTRDPLDDVYAWYLAQLPSGTPHAFSEQKQQGTFALFDAHGRRTVHVEREGATTAIMLTNLKQ